jgi:hypothetical protein
MSGETPDAQRISAADADVCGKSAKNDENRGFPSPTTNADVIDLDHRLDRD